MKSISQRFGRLMLALMMIIVLVSVAACSSKSKSILSPTPSPGIIITQPLNGSTIPAGNVNVSVQVSNITLIDVMGVANMPGQAHIHYYMDVDPPTTPHQPTDTAPGTYAMTAATSYIWHNVSLGPHKFAVELINNDDTPLIPPVTDIINITIQAAISTPVPTATPQPGKIVTIDLVAQKMLFDKKTITVPAGANVTLNFNNKDSSIAHNFALYDSSTTLNALFVGQIILGPANVVYQFTAPKTPGTYFFRCDVHPTTMTGSFIVTASGSIGY